MKRETRIRTIMFRLGMAAARNVTAPRYKVTANDLVLIALTSPTSCHAGG